jgi:hypothetical protein
LVCHSDRSPVARYAPSTCLTLSLRVAKSVESRRPGTCENTLLQFELRAGMRRGLPAALDPGGGCSSLKPFRECRKEEMVFIFPKLHSI